MHPIGLMDVILAMRTLGRGAEEPDRILALLGLRYVEDDGASKQETATPTATHGPAPGARPAAARPQSPPPAEGEGPNHAWLQSIVRSTGGILPDWYRQASPLPRDALPRELRRPVPDDLLPPERRRNLLLALISRLENGPEADTDLLVTRIAQRQPLGAIPRRKKNAVRRGAQILLDIGDRMQPFADDLTQLAKSLARLLRADQIQFAHCRGAPPGCEDPELLGEQYLYPAPGTPVLLVSDLGQGPSRAMPPQTEIESWLAFAARLAAQDSRLTVLAPVSPRRISLRLRRQLEIFSWDRTLTERDIKAQRRRLMRSPA